MMKLDGLANTGDASVTTIPVNPFLLRGLSSDVCWGLLLVEAGASSEQAEIAYTNYLLTELRRHHGQA